MAGEQDAAESKRLETASTARRKLIGQAIIDGVLKPSDAVILAIADYNQGGGNYTQVGGDHKQGPNGDYNQSRFGIGDPFINVIRGQGVIRD